ncbi:MAG: cache domain-containing protein [Sedimentisphaerales bacterium]|nr:cache domain-containing protein [Sedimentisphaerales bacterium]
MKMSLRAKLIISFLTAITICGFVATIISVRLIDTGIIQQEKYKVKNDLNSARLIYQQEVQKTADIVRFAALKFLIVDAVINNNVEQLKKELEERRKTEHLDILTLTDKDGRVLVRARNPFIYGDDQSNNAVIAKVLKEKQIAAGTVIVSKQELEKDGDDLARQALIKIIKTPHSTHSSYDQSQEHDVSSKEAVDTEQVSSNGMIISAGAPVFDNEGNLIGILYGGKLINRNYDIVDKTKEVVYKDAKYKGKDIGTATIFQNDLRISTNVLDNDGNRAIGTLLSDEVKKQVLENGLTWTSPAFVVNNWYISAYEPIRDVQDKIIGVLYVGVLEENFIDMRNKTILLVLGLMFVGMIIAAAVAGLLANSILKPVENLVHASGLWAKGNLDYRVKTSGGDEISELCETLNNMASSLRERSSQLRKYTDEQIMKSERLLTLGRLAAGVAHEINNPLGAILMYTYLSLEDMDDKETLRKNLGKTISEASRCQDIVKGLFNFAHQTEPKVELANINDILERTLQVMKDQVLFRNITIKRALHPSLPKLSVDIGQMQQVFTNIILNAADAMEGSGELTVTAFETDDKKYIQIEFADTGTGIPPENIEKIFEPFFTTKQPGKGTGLGLAVSYGIIASHKGTIEVKNAPGHGAVFIIRLPV